MILTWCAAACWLAREWLIDDMRLVTLREAGNQEVALLRANG